MAEKLTIQERVTEIFGYPNVYTELREKIIDSIKNELYYSRLKDTHFNEKPEVFEQFVDVFIEDILKDSDFINDLKILNKYLQNEHTPKELFIYRRDHSTINQDFRPMSKKILDICSKIAKKKRLTKEEEDFYKEYKEKEEELSANNQLVRRHLEGEKLNNEEIEKMNNYLQSLMTEEEALAQLEKENEPKINNLRKQMKRKYFGERLSKMPERLDIISNPFDLTNYRTEDRIFKGNGNAEFISVDKPSNKKSGHDFDVSTEYIIITENRTPYYFKDSLELYYGRRAFKSHYAHKILIYLPRENEYPEGTHLSDLIRRKKERNCEEELKVVFERIRKSGFDPKKFCDAVLREEESKKEEK